MKLLFIQIITVAAIIAQIANATSWAGYDPVKQKYVCPFCMYSADKIRSAHIIPQENFNDRKVTLMMRET